MRGTVYQGSELEVFREARTWKRYWAATIQAFVRGDVLDVGCGLGATADVLYSPQASHWVCLEPDPQLAAAAAAFLNEKAPGAFDVRVNTITDLATHEHFDTILYIDVLEHIEDDAAQLRLAADHLRPGGRLIVLAPAHQALYSAFDRAVGHHRRYDKRSLGSVTPPRLTLQRLFYLDTAGLMASLANRLFLKQDIPSARQISFWDKRIIPLSRVLDPLFRNALGKTIVGIWTAR